MDLGGLSEPLLFLPAGYSSGAGGDGTALIGHVHLTTVEPTLGSCHVELTK